MSAVAVGVDIGAADSVVAVGGSSAELLVRGQETSVDDVTKGTGTG